MKLAVEARGQPFEQPVLVPGEVDAGDPDRVEPERQCQALEFSRKFRNSGCDGSFIGVSRV
jgi:hypothetical protein